MPQSEYRIVGGLESFARTYFSGHSSDYKYVFITDFINREFFLYYRENDYYFRILSVRLDDVSDYLRCLTIASIQYEEYKNGTISPTPLSNQDLNEIFSQEELDREDEEDANEDEDFDEEEES